MAIPPPPITRFSPAGERRDGLVFMMLIDDSGSMYKHATEVSPSPDRTQTALGRAPELSGRTWIIHGPGRSGRFSEPDTGFWPVPEPIGRVWWTVWAPFGAPESEEAYTELYAAITESAGDMSSQKGRRIVILFSTAKTILMPSARGSPIRCTVKKFSLPTRPLLALQGEGITLYAVRFGPNRDADPPRIALATGGVVFSDVNGEEKYLVRERVLAEYRLEVPGHLTGCGPGRYRVALHEPVLPPNWATHRDSSSVSSTRNQALLSLLAIPFALFAIFLLGPKYRAG